MRARQGRDIRGRGGQVADVVDFQTLAQVFLVRVMLAVGLLLLLLLLLVSLVATN